MVSGIYRILNKINGKCYVGSAVNITKRWNEHKRELAARTHHAKHLLRAWHKYGCSKFSFEILEKCESKELLIKEQSWIDKLKSANKDFGYNSSPFAGSTLGFKHSENSKEIMRSLGRGGEGSPTAILNWELVRAIRQEYINSNITTRLLSQKYKVGKTTINHILNYDTWQENDIIVENAIKKKKEEIIASPGKKKLTQEQVDEIRTKYKPYKCSTYTIAKEYGVRQTTIYDIVTDKIWRRRPMLMSKNKEVKIRDKNFYNLASAKLLDWTPSWFGCSEFDNNLVSAIENFQLKNGLKVDGLCGAQTYRSILAEREASQWLAENELEKKAMGAKGLIVAGDARIPIKWDKFVGMNDPGNLAMTSGFIKVNSVRKPKIFICHWDAALSAKSCRDILARRHLSVHFCIDNGGEIYQLVDCNNSAQHAGLNNMNSIGVEISNAVELKYQKYYESKGFGPRPIWMPTVHKGYLGKILGFYPIQIQALEALLTAVCGHYEIPFETPMVEGTTTPTQLMAVSKLAAQGKFSGVACHYHLTKDKVDPAGLDMLGLMERLKKGV